MIFFFCNVKKMIDKKKGCKDEKCDGRKKGPTEKQKKKLPPGLIEYMRKHKPKTHRAKQ